MSLPSFAIGAVSFIMASITGFASVFTSGTIDFRQPPEQLGTPVRQHIVDGSNYGQSNGISVGITVIDRANHNRIIWNDRDAHTIRPLAGLTKSFIAGYILRKHPRAQIHESDKLSAMMSLDSHEATDYLWKKYGGQHIIEETSERYNLQEMKIDSVWGNVQASSYDVARFYRGFLDDASVPVSVKKYFIGLMKKSQKFVNGTDLTWGFPTALNFHPNVGWRQGWWNKSAGLVIRNSSVIITNDDGAPRVIAVMMGKFPKYMSDDEASRRATEMASIVSGDGLIVSDQDAPSVTVSRWTERVGRVWNPR